MADFPSLLFPEIVEQLFVLVPLLVIVACIKRMLCSPRTKGAIGEWFTSKRVLGKLDTLLYSIHNDVYLPRPDGRGTTQIDHVVVSPYGVFVIETKNMKGWIFGDVNSKQWTQTIYRKKYRFQNPLHQNSLHVSALKSFLGISAESLKSVVFFVGFVTLKTELPANVLTSGLRAYIERFQTQLLSADECNRIRLLLDKANREKDRKMIKKKHLRGIQERELTPG